MVSSERTSIPGQRVRTLRMDSRWRASTSGLSAAGAKRGTRERRGVVDPGAAPQRRCVVDALAEDLGLDSGEGGLEAEPAEDLATLAEDVENGAGVVPGQEGLEGIG